MSKLELLKDQEYVFGSLLAVANKLDTLLERELSQFDMTTKQWFLSMMVDTLFETPPTIKEVAKVMGSSHQNVKQVALKLKQKGFLRLEKDTKDARATRIILTHKSKAFGENMQEKGMVFKKEVFKNVSNEEMLVARKMMEKIWSNLEVLDNK